MQINSVNDKSTSFGMSTKALRSVNKYATMATTDALLKNAFGLAKLGNDVNIKYAMEKFYEGQKRQLVVKFSEMKNGLFQKVLARTYTVDESDVLRSVTESKKTFVDSIAVSDARKLARSLYA